MATSKKNTVKKDSTTEEKIKHAARVVFHKKGYAAARTRDIAEEAGLNLALLNYYFRGKKKLFDMIMLETMQALFHSITLVLNDANSTLEEKVQMLVDKYIDLFIQEPDMPIFLLSELRSSESTVLQQLNVQKVMANSVLFRQWGEAAKANQLPMHPLHLMVNLMSLIVFPFIGSPIIKKIGSMKQQEFNKMMLDRKKLIPKWVKSIIKTK